MAIITTTYDIPADRFSVDGGGDSKRFDFTGVVTFQTDDTTLLTKVIVDIYAKRLAYSGDFVLSGDTGLGIGIGIFKTGNVPNMSKFSTLPGEVSYFDYDKVSSSSYTLIASETFTNQKFYNNNGFIGTTYFVAVLTQYQSTRYIENSTATTTSNFGHYAKVGTNVALSRLYLPSDIYATNSAYLGEELTISIVPHLYIGETYEDGTAVYPRHDFTYQFGTKTGTAKLNVRDTVFKWRIPTSLISEFADDEIQKTGTLICETFGWDNSQNNMVSHGTTSVEFVAFLPRGELAPQLSPTVKDINPNTVALTGNENSFVRYFSTAQYAINATAVRGAEIVSQQIMNGSTTITNQPNGTISNVESGTFRFLVVDNRDLGTAMTMITPNFVNYIKLTCSQEITMDITSEYGATAQIKVAGNYFNGSFGAVRNEIKLEVRQTQNDGTMSDWVDITILLADISNNQYEATFNASGLRYDIPYTFQFRVTDKLGTATTSPQTIRVLPVFDWSDQDFNFNVPVTFSNNLTVPSALNLGDTCSVANQENNLVLNSNAAVNVEARNINLNAVGGSINLDGSNVYLNGTNLVSIEAGEWYPSLGTDAAIQSYSVQKGWYEKIENTVTVGFMITALCNTGHTSTGLVINGLPFTPAFTAFGGGVCSNTHVAAGFNFQCWAANTNGTITARVQDCNNTENASLTTSASGCYYGAGSVTITLGGTISYQITE